MHWAALPRRRRECPRGLPEPPDRPEPPNTLKKDPLGALTASSSVALRCESRPKGTGPGRARAGQGGRSPSLLQLSLADGRQTFWPVYSLRLKSMCFPRASRLPTQHHMIGCDISPPGAG